MLYLINSVNSENLYFLKQLTLSISKLYRTTSNLVHPFEWKKKLYFFYNVLTQNETGVSLSFFGFEIRSKDDFSRLIHYNVSEDV